MAKRQTIQLPKDRQYNGQKTKKKYERTNNDLQITTQKTKDRATRTPIRTWEGVELRFSGRVSSSCSTCDTHLVTVTQHEHHLI